jgi:hypothetical protein
MRKVLLAHSAIACCVLAGCDGVFGLQHLPTHRDASVSDGMSDGRVDAPRDAAADTNCGAPTGAVMTKTFGPRLAAVPVATTDTYLSDDSARLEANFGGIDRLFICLQCSCDSDCDAISDTGDDDVVTLIRFELAFEVPRCSAVQAATLRLHTNGDNLGGGSTVMAYEVLEDWDEGTNTVLTGSTGVASWNKRKPNTAWTTAGAGAPGSHGGSFVGTFAPTSTETDHPMTLNATVVQRWVDTPATNHGLVLVIEGSTSDVHFYSTESGMTSKRPALVLTYREP